MFLTEDGNHEYVGDTESQTVKDTGRSTPGAEAGVT
jgi:hypothetical protein